MADFASAAATKALKKKNHNLKFNTLGRTELVCSAVGFGSYRVHISVDEHRNALTQAIQSGFNLIDTSSNYADGGSEELIGAVLKNEIAEKTVSRDELIIVSKAGYLQGQNYQLYQQLKAEEAAFPEVVEYADGLAHCIHPDFIADQITRSLNRLQLKTIDVFLLHNPEYYLLWAHNQQHDLQSAQQEYYKRLDKAFMQLEIEVQNGRIRHYGVSSNTFPVSAIRYDFTSLEKTWQIAQSISPDHHFSVIQLPFNLLENGAATENNLSEEKTVLQFAKEKNIAVLTNRPLNAFAENKMQRLVSVEPQEEMDMVKLEDAVNSVVELEKTFENTILAELDVKQETQKELAGYFSSGRYLQANRQKLGPYWQWIGNQAQFLSEQVSYAIQLINEVEKKSANVIQWADKYVEAYNLLLGQLTLFYGHQTSARNKKLVAHFAERQPDFKDYQQIQHIALKAVLETPAVSSVLVGMRQQTYVDDVLSVLGQPETQLNPHFWKK